MTTAAVQTLLLDLEAIRATLSDDDYDALQRRVSAYGKALRTGIETSSLSRDECRDLQRIHHDVLALMRQRRDEAIAWLKRNRSMHKAIRSYSSSHGRGLWWTP